MGQKINPVSLRLHYTNRNFDNCWYSNYFYKNLINKDIVLQYYLHNFLKCLKLPTGRYSIQHLQKKTQVFNFLCYSKSTREWRSKLFGLAKKKNVLKKTRFFFKKKTLFKKTRKNYTKFHYFYKTLNQIAVHKIQKRITSFQNFRLWAALQKKTVPNSFYLSSSSRFSIKGSLLPFSSKTEKFIVPGPFFFLKKAIKKKEKQKLSCFQKGANQKTNIFSFGDDIFSENSFIKEKTLYSSKSTKSKNLERHLEQQFLFKQQFCSQSNKESLLFLQNLFLYKILKKELKNKNTIFSKFPAFQRSRDDIQSHGSFNLLEYKYKNHLEFSLKSLYNLELDYIPFRVTNDWQHANYLADEIVYFLEKRIPFRRLKNKILKQLSKISTIRGVRITCSGRVGGKSKKAQRAKTECIKYGQTSLQVFSSKIDFSMKTAFTSFGSVGVKVWICYY